ncbi:hypothetical protein [Thermithiobacillus plumbiphilus]|uniref:Porin n=1 Tax=Thermithiobacillus plumbiphilus TaxID=1729899 RepID=A0ABU9D6U0_9PROT
MICLSKHLAVQGRGILAQSISAALVLTTALVAQNAAAVEAAFGGQYRINSYYVQNSNVAPDGTFEDAAASRLRIRQNIDLKFDENFSTHLQFELGHTRDNIITTSNPLRVRHAEMTYKFKNGITGEAGLVPLSDKFGDTQYSADWDFNPLAGLLYLPAGSGNLRLGAANLAQGAETSRVPGDFSLYTADYVLPLGGNNQVNVGGSLAQIAASDDQSNPRRTQLNYGVGARFSLTEGLLLNGFLQGSKTDKDLLGTNNDASGLAAKLELTGHAGAGDFGLMGTYATGKSNGTGFQPVMALAKTNGYWGYTGILTVQGPTDTGFDGDTVNISNNGYGLATVQAKYSFPITSNLSGYLGAGWLGGSKAAGRSGTVGTDVLAMGTYRFTKVLALNFGADYAKVKDSDSGYFQGAAGEFNQGVGVNRNKLALFSRLQAEF